MDAWIDDLGGWVLLDAQNGSYWAYGDDRPLSSVELQQICRTGSQRPAMVGCADEADFWWPYFDTVNVGELRWSDDGFCPVFQDRFLMQTARLMRTPDAVYPDLGLVWIGVGGLGTNPS